MIIKEKPEDFVVEEITSEGEILEVGKPQAWKGGEGDYLIFVLEKKNWDTIGALREIAIRAKVSKRRFSFAGTKDRRAVTTQRVSAWKISKEQLEDLKIKDITLKPIQYSQEPVRLGDLWGNRFTVVVKGAKYMKKPNDKIPNFFGPQRFGEVRPITHLVGRAIVNEQYELAVETYLCQSFPKEKEEERLARERLLKEGNYAEALKYFPRHLKYERTLLGHLAKAPKDYVGALSALPKSLLLMFVHAYQAYLFNKVLEKRLKLIGLEPTKGDILAEGVPTGPLFGYEVMLATGKPGEIEHEVLSEEWLELEDFKIYGMPFLSTKGSRRPLYITIKDFQILEKVKDYIKVRFSLPKSTYATTVLSYLFE